MNGRRRSFEEVRIIKFWNGNINMRNNILSDRLFMVDNDESLVVLIKNVS